MQKTLDSRDIGGRNDGESYQLGEGTMSPCNGTAKDIL